MSIQTYVTRTFQQSSNIVTATSAPANTTLLSIVNSVSASGTVSEPCPYIAANATAIYVYCDTSGVTMTPNTGASSVLTFSDPTIPFEWQLGNPAQAANPWSANFATQSIYNPNPTTANFQIYVLSSGS